MVENHELLQIFNPLTFIDQMIGMGLPSTAIGFDRRAVSPISQKASTKRWNTWLIFDASSDLMEKLK